MGTSMSPIQAAAEYPPKAAAACHTALGSRLSSSRRAQWANPVSDRRPLATLVMTCRASTSGRSSGPGGPGTNPEQLFAVGYAACFQSSLLRFAAGRKLDLTGSRITARVRFGPVMGGGFGIAVALDLDAPQLDRADAVDLMERAHEACPYSRATRGNIEVALTVSGTTIERKAS